MSKSFDAVAKEQFGFLESQYGYRLAACDKENWGCKLIYLSNVTGVEVVFEYREACVFVMLYKLVEGTLQKNSRNIDGNTVLHGYSLDDLVSIRSPQNSMKPTYRYDEQSIYFEKDVGFGQYVAAFAENLRCYAKDVLCGDFEIFLELDRVVKERARALNL